MKNDKKKNKKNDKFNDYFLYGCFSVTVFLSITLVLAFCNICYLPPNTTGECVIARSIMSFDYYVLFLIFETIFSAIVTILYLIDGIRYKIKKYKIVCLLNILLQPFVLIFIAHLLGW